VTDSPENLLAGKVVVVTGGTAGIGKAMALGFAQAGADVAYCSRSGEGLEDVAREIEGLGARALPVRADVSQKSEVDSMVARAVEQFGRIDILVNNAAIAVKGQTLDTEEDVWDRVIDTNLKGCYLCCSAAGRVMVKRKQGSIVNIASTMAFRALANRTAYSVSKAGVIMLTRVMARELGEHNIRVNAIAPGTVRTRMNESWLGDPDATAAALANIPLGRIAEPEDLVGAALFLASDNARWITGSTIVADGGFLA
jgi:NAD(P)-dependent dehydrogenase (short-subunit alcohol dehydrogenase family)